MHITNYTDSQMTFCDVPCRENSYEQQRNSKKFNGAPKTMFLAKILHHNSNSAHIEENKIITLRMVLCALNEKKRLAAQSIQNPIIWCPISVAKKVFML